MIFYVSRRLWTSTDLFSLPNCWPVILTRVCTCPKNSLSLSIIGCYNDWTIQSNQQSFVSLKDIRRFVSVTDPRECLLLLWFRLGWMGTLVESSPKPVTDRTCFCSVRGQSQVTPLGLGCTVTMMPHTVTSQIESSEEHLPLTFTCGG